MQLRNHFGVVLFCCLTITLARAQHRDTLSDLKIGQWQQHLPWRQAKHVTLSDTKAYLATEWAVVEVDKQDFSPRFLSKTEGLSDVGIQLIRYSREAGCLLIVYTNSNMDLWYPHDGSLINMPFIVKNLNLTGDRRIYDVLFDNKAAYLCAGFGLVKIDLTRKEVEYTVFTGRAVRSFAIYRQNLYMGTQEGLYTLPVNHPFPADFGQWQYLDVNDGFPAVYSAQCMAVFAGKLYFGSKKILYQYDGSGLEVVRTHPVFEVLYLTTAGAGLLVGWREQFNGEVEYRTAEGKSDLIHWTCDASRPLYGVEDGTRRFWLADNSPDFRFFDWDKNECRRFKYNSPATHRVSEMVFSGNTLFAATPGPASDLKPPYARDGVLTNDNGIWKQFSLATHPELQDGDCYADMWKIAVHPQQPDVFYTGSWVGGLIENKGGQVKCYTQHNSVLKGAGASGPNRTAIGGLAYDRDNNLWISNFGSTAPIAVLKNDGTLSNFSNAPANNLLQVAIDGNGYKWFVVAFNGGVLVYDSGDNIQANSDDRYRLINASNSVLPTNTVNCLAADLDGNIWVGTQQGVVSFECGSTVFKNECRGSRRILKIDDFNGYLLETENVTCIAVDGANRKWFGTTNGLFVISASGNQQIAKFTTSNSPLFSNEITCLAYHPRSGEIWIGTLNGLQTFRSDATLGGKVHAPTVYAYPNPVPPDYDGYIAVYGLARDSNVKITDATGKLVFEGQSLGGQMIWNGRDYTGRRVASGVYLIFATSQAAFDIPDTVVAKVLVLSN